MKVFKNFKPCSISTSFRKELTDINPHVKFLSSEDGRDWYQIQGQFSPETVKVAFDDNGIIRGIETDVTALWPVGLSVAELNAGDVPEGVNIFGGWQYSDGKIIERVYTHEELVAQAEREKQRLVRDAAEVIAPLEDAVEFDLATDKERAQLISWKEYRIALSRIDADSAPEITWPYKPDDK